VSRYHVIVVNRVVADDDQEFVMSAADDGAIGSLDDADRLVHAEVEGAAGNLDAWIGSGEEKPSPQWPTSRHRFVVAVWLDVPGRVGRRDLLDFERSDDPDVTYHFEDDRCVNRRVAERAVPS
jgi:hypothetical protein